MQSTFPKLTIVAEVKNPEAFSKALDAVIVALNQRAQGPRRSRKPLEERKEAEKKDEPGRGGGAGARVGGGGGGDRTKPRGSLQQTPAPRFDDDTDGRKGESCSSSRRRAISVASGPDELPADDRARREPLVFARQPRSAHEMPSRP